MQGSYTIRLGDSKNLHIGVAAKGACMDGNHFLSAVEMTSLSSCQSNPLPFPCCSISSGEHLPVSKTLLLIAQPPAASLSGKQGPGVIWGIGLNRNMHTPKRQKSFSLWRHSPEPRS